jgi:hypothetical protein
MLKILAQKSERTKENLEAKDLWKDSNKTFINALNAVLNTIRHLLALAGDHHFVHVSRIRFK